VETIEDRCKLWDLRTRNQKIDITARPIELSLATKNTPRNVCVIQFGE